MKRIVTGHAPDGASVILMQEPIKTAYELAGIEVKDVWLTDSMPASLAGKADPIERAYQTHPPRSGTVFRLVVFPPPGARRGEANEAASEDDRNFYGPHSTRTVDYVVVLSGRLVMTVGDSEVTLDPGDCVVQLGAEHDWRNAGAGPCVIAAVLVSAEP